jgi:hypothetical protein
MLITHILGKYYHFENILKKEGFELVSLCIPKKLDADTREALTEMLQEITDEQFEDYIRADNKDLDIYKPINDRVVILNLSSDDVELLRNYKDIIMSKYKIKEHFSITNLLKTDDYISNKFEQLKGASLKSNLLKYDAFKLVLLREFEK